MSESRGWAAILCELLIKRNATQSAAERREEESERGNCVSMVMASTFISRLRLESHQSTLSPAPRCHAHEIIQIHRAFAQSDGHVKHMSSALKPSELTKLDSIVENCCKQQTCNHLKQILRQTRLHILSKTSLS